MGKSRNNAIFAGFVTSSTPGEKDSLIFTGSNFIYGDVQLTDNLTVTESNGVIEIKEVFTSSIQSIPNLTALGNVVGSDQYPQAIAIQDDLSVSIAAHNTLPTAKSVKQYVDDSVPILNSGNLKKWTETGISGKNISHHTYQKRIWVDKSNHIVGNGYTGYNEFGNYHNWAWREQIHLPDGNEIPSKVYAGYHHIAVLTESGSLYFAGRNNNNMFSVDSPQSGDYRQPQLLRGFLSDDGQMDNVKFTKVAFAEEHYPVNIAALTDGGSVYVAGYNQYGQLGSGSAGNNKSTYKDGVGGQISSTPLWDGTSNPAVDIFMMGQWDGGSHTTTTVIQLDDGEMRTCGWGRYGQIGNGSSSDSNPTLTTVLTTTGTLTNVTSSIVWGYDKETGVFAVTDNGGGSGSLYGWGYGGRNPFGFSPASNSNVTYATRLDNTRWSSLRNGG